MAHIEGGFKFRLALNLLPSVEKFEKQDSDFRKAFEDHLAFEKSAEYLEFQKLSAIVNQKDFEARLQKIRNEKYEGSEAFTKEKSYISQKKSKELTLYFRFKGSPELDSYSKTLQSNDLKRFNALEKELATPEFKEKISSSDKDIKSQARLLRDEYQTLRKDAAIRNYLKLKDSSILKNYQTIEGSKKLEDFLTLEKYVQSSEFANIKKDLLDKDRYKRFEEYQQWERFQHLSNLPVLKTFQKNQKEGTFLEIASWKTVFSDQFSKKLPDPAKWLKSYYGAHKSQTPYSLYADPHFLTDGKNLEPRENSICIRTKKEKCKGKAWDPKFGFREKEFSFTSGILSTGDFFRMEHGKIEAKVKLSGSGDVLHAFWMIGDRMVPHINLFKYHQGRLIFEILSDLNNKEGASLKASKFLNKYFIISVFWDKNQIEWAINGTKFMTITASIPANPMFLNLSSGVIPSNDEPQAEGEFEIAWIRCAVRGSKS